MKAGFRKTTTQTQIARLMLLLLVLFAICLIATISIYETVMETIRDDRAANLSDITSQMTEQIDTVSRHIWNMTDIAFAKMLVEEELTSEEMIKHLVLSKEALCNDKLYPIAIDTNENMYTHEGQTGIWFGVHSLSSGVPDEQILMKSTNVGSGRISKAKNMVFLKRLEKSITLDNETKITHIGLVLLEEYYMEKFSLKGFTEEGDVYIVNTKGNSIYRREHAGILKNTVNPVSTIQGNAFIYAEDYKTFTEKIRNNEPVTMEFSHENQNYFVSYAPSNTFKWAVMTVVPTEKLGENFADAIWEVTGKLLIIITVALIVGALVIHYFLMFMKTKDIVDEEKQRNQWLLQTKEEAIRANNTKSEFLSSVSHDLRTPINGICGLVAIAEKNKANPDIVQKCLDKINVTAEYLSSLINYVLDMRALEKGVWEDKDVSFDVQKLLRECEVILQGNVSFQKINFFSDSSEIIHNIVIGQDLYLRQILLNILGNAVKFTGKGGFVRLSAKELPVNEENSAIFRFVISDTGKGMSQEYLAHLFEPFTQEKTGSGVKHKGSGLGMAITKRLVDKMDGTIKVESTLNKGSIFTVDIPLKLDENLVIYENLSKNEELSISKKSKNQRQEITGKSLSGMKILLAEDNELNFEITKYLLVDAGAEIIEAHDGEEALEVFKSSEENSIDLILMDVIMPKMDGITATKKIRNFYRSDSKTVPVIAMTANAFEEDEKKTKEAGMNEHLSKPIDIEVLISTVTKYRNDDREN